MLVYHIIVLFALSDLLQPICFLTFTSFSFKRLLAPDAIYVPKASSRLENQPGFTAKATVLFHLLAQTKQKHMHNFIKNLQLKDKRRLQRVLPKIPLHQLKVDWQKAVSHFFPDSSCKHFPHKQGQRRSTQHLREVLLKSSSIWHSVLSQLLRVTDQPNCVYQPHILTVFHEKAHWVRDALKDWQHCKVS